MSFSSLKAVISGIIRKIVYIQKKNIISAKKNCLKCLLSIYCQDVRKLDGSNTHRALLMDTGNYRLKNASAGKRGG